MDDVKNGLNEVWQLYQRYRGTDPEDGFAWEFCLSECEDIYHRYQGVDLVQKFLFDVLDEIDK